MPPLPPVTKTIRVIIHTQASGGMNCQTRFHMTYTGLMSGTDATTLTNTVGASWNTRLAPNTGTRYALQAVQIIDLGSQSGVDIVTPIAHAGTGADQGVAAAVSLVVSNHVALRYRGGHSRVYIVGPTLASLQDVNTWTLTAQGTFFTAWTGLVSDMQTSPPVGVGSLAQVAVHQYSSNPKDFPGGPPTTKPPWPLATPLTYPVVSSSVNPQVGSQRRRNQQ